MPKDASPWMEVLAHYSLGRVISLEAGGGTAASKVWVSTAQEGRYLLRSRRPAASEDEVIAFDHGVIRAVVEAGLPSVAPEMSREGRTWVRLDERAYELFPVIEGLAPFQPGNRRQLAAAAQTLARFHRATAGLTPPGRKHWEREHRIEAMRDTLAEVLAGASGAPDRADAVAMLASAQKLARAPLSSWARALPSAIIHGDYTPANVLFRAGQVGGIFDYDWVSRQPRIVDLGEALIFFAFARREPINPDSIWSLVQGWEPDLIAARAFLAAYQAEWPLDREEARALPFFMRETWLGVRIRAMRKVRPDEQLRILTQGGLEPLQWLEQAPHLVEGLVGESASLAGMRPTG